MALNITITDAGKAEVIKGLNPVTDPAAISEQVLALGNALAAIVEVGLGSGKYVPSKTQQNLQSEIKRVETVSGVAVSDNTLHIMIQDHSTDVYNVSELGLYTATGTLFAVYSDPVEDFIQKTADSDLLISLDITLNDINTATIVLGDTTFVNPPASETTSGVAKIATQEQVNIGTNDSTIVTPKKLKSWIKQASESISGMLKIGTQQQTDLGANDSVAVSPKKLQQKLSDNCLGMGQNWVDVGLLRLLDVNYTNSTGRPIFVTVSAGDNNNGLVSYIHTFAKVNGVSVAISGSAQIGSTVGFSVSFIVPAGAIYRVETASNVAAVVRAWSELR